MELLVADVEVVVVAVVKVVVVTVVCSRNHQNQLILFRKKKFTFFAEKNS